MKKITDIIKENISTNIYSYSVKLDIKGNVHAENEGAAGEEVDKEMDVIMAAISETGIGASAENYEIENIELALNGNSNNVAEQIDNNKVLESLDSDRKGELYVLGQQIADTINSEYLRDYSDEELDFLIERIKAGLDDILDQFRTPEQHQRKYSVGSKLNQDLSDILNAAMTNYDDYVNKIEQFNSEHDMNLQPLPEPYISHSANFDWEDGEELSAQEIQLRWDSMLEEL